MERTRRLRQESARIYSSLRCSGFAKPRGRPSTVSTVRYYRGWAAVMFNAGHRFAFGVGSTGEKPRELPIDRDSIPHAARGLESGCALKERVSGSTIPCHTPSRSVWQPTQRISSQTQCHTPGTWALSGPSGYNRMAGSILRRGGVRGAAVRGRNTTAAKRRTQ